MHQIQAEIGLPKISLKKLGDNHAVFSIGPLPSGYGMTLGNSLRRILLSSLPGSAVTGVKIEGVSHEYLALDGVKDTVLNMILNLKQLNIQKHSKEKSTITLKASKEGDVKAEDIEIPGDLEILNPDMVITTLDKNRKLNVEIVVEKGVGYLPISAREKDNTDPGLILVDAFFSPVKKVCYEVKDTRVGQTTNLDKLEMEILTSGSISPEDALKFAANVLKSYFGIFDKGVTPVEAEFMTDISTITQKKEEEDAEEAKKAEEKYTPIEVLNFSPRTLNSLINGGIGSMEELIEYPRDELVVLRGFGKKAMDEVEEKLSARGLRLQDEGGKTDMVGGEETEIQVKQDEDEQDEPLIS